MSDQVFISVLLLMSVLLFCSVCQADPFHSDKQIALRKFPKEKRKNCCKRESRLKYIGESASSGDKIEIDVGRCRKRCSEIKYLKKKQFQKLLSENPSMDPISVFKMYSRKNSNNGAHSCPIGKMCEASRSRVEKVLTQKGPMTVTIIEDCSCQESRRRCHRYRRMVTLYKGTPLEVTIDVGSCRGHCGKDMKCQPLFSKTTSIEGPNGAECITIIEKCGCAGECYKMSHYQQYFDYSHGVQRIKLVDIGKCVGVCNSDKKPHCLQRDEENGTCLLSLRSTSECSASYTDSSSITEKNGLVKNITTVTQCQCI